MAGININIDGLTAVVAKVRGVKASVVEFVAQIVPRMQAAVDAALVADDAADQGSVEVANAAIAGVATELTNEADAITAAITTNPGPTDPPPVEPAPPADPPQGDPPQGFRRR